MVEICSCFFSLHILKYSQKIILYQISQCSESDKKIVSIDENYIKAFRAKYYDEPVEKLEDLDPRSEDVIAILSQIKDLEKKGFDLLNTVPENGATCSIQLKFYITAVVNRAKEQSDYCVLRNLKKETRRELNVSHLLLLALIFI